MTFSLTILQKGSIINMKHELSGDVYIYMHREDEAVQMGFAQSVEEFEECSEYYDIIQWMCITGDNMYITDCHTNTEIRLIQEEENES